MSTIRLDEIDKVNLYDRAQALYHEGQVDAALACCDAALLEDAQLMPVWFFRGSILFNQGQLQAAAESYKKALALDSKNVQTLFLLGSTFFNLKQFDAALEQFDAALLLEKNNPHLWLRHAMALRALGRFEKACDSCDYAIALDSNYAQAFAERGVILLQLKHFEKALSDCTKARCLCPEDVSSLLNEANILLRLERYHEALLCYEVVLKQDPTYFCVLGNYLHLKMTLCEWRDFDRWYLFFIEKVKEGVLVTTPFVATLLVSDAVVLKEYTQRYCQFQHSRIDSGDILGPYDHKKIRVAYFSADFYVHPTMYLMAEFFECHNHDDFEWIAFSWGGADDLMRQRAQGSFDQFIDISCKTDEEVVALARSMEIDIAVDLKGITRNSRLEIFAKRLAPIQVSYLGYPGTLGAEFIDYLIADDVLIPEKCQMYYCEKIAYLPYTYQPNDQKREIASSRWTRSQLGLPETGFVYCCFNNGFKLMPEVFTVWMHLLRRVPGSVLWLLGEEDVVLNLRAQAEKQGVDGERLIFASAVPLAQHLARQQYADLFLDTWPCNAHTTASDSLWAGLPVLTYCGLTFASRVAASLLNALDLPELVTFSREEYEEQAYILATQPNKLSSVREKIKQVKGQSPLFSGKLRAQHIEALYKEMVRKKGHGLSPESFHLFDF